MPAKLPLRNRLPLRRGAFTLVEILLVVMILGLLAAVVVPQFSTASETARATSTLSMLKTMRAQLELYRVHHEEQYPELDQLWDNMLERTDTDGNLDENGSHGPYLQKPPVNPYTGSSDVAALDEGTLSDGWEYDEQSGTFRAVGFDEDTETFTKPDP